MNDPAARLAEGLAGRYRIERELGAGGMATVHLAHDLRHDRRVAIKVLRPELAAALGAERFLREITTTANLRHPHILPLYDSGEAGGLLYYVMPLVEGESLRDRLDREKQLPIEDALRIAGEVADALSYAHARGVLHRDIKPENILLESGHAVVADFGIARAVSAAGEAALTQTGLAIGTPKYMSPEQAAGERDLDGRTDLYALGCVLFEMLAGQPPFTGPTPESVVRQHLAAPPPSVIQYRPAVPAEVAAALQRALAKTPADRFNLVALFAEALRRPAGPPSMAAAAPGVRPLVVGAAVLLLAIAVAASLLLRTRGGGEDIPGVGRTTRVTLEPGLEVDPALSPDGQMVAYAAGSTTRMGILVRQVAGGRTVALTSETAGNFRSPRWSPDGTRIAFQANDGIWIVPALGGVPRLVTRAVVPLDESFGSAMTPVAGLTWSPDGRRIAFLSGSFGGGRLILASVETGDTTSLPAPRDSHSPTWSPDGSRIAVASGNPIFVFGMTYFGNAGASSLWTVPVDGGAPVRVTEEAFMDASPQWSPDGKALWFLSDREGSRDVYRIAVDRSGAPRGEPVRITTGLDAHTISLSADETRLAWSQLELSSNIWSLPVPKGGPVSAAGARPVTTGRQTIEDVDVSPDGRWLVLDSDRSGHAEIYRMAAEGGEPVPLTSDGAGNYAAAWSPDGQQVVFHSLRTGNRDLFTMNADGTGLVQRTVATRHELDADWSPDGDSLVAEILASAERPSLIWFLKTENFSETTARSSGWSPFGPNTRGK